jgi:3',5'-cyclic AMP phosphodiesterase CpdA
VRNPELQAIELPFQISIAILSDPHFCERNSSGNGSEHSHIVIDSLSGGRDPLWRHLKRLIKDEGVASDLLLCPGDITTHANPRALTSAWEELVELGGLLKAEAVAVATGNHDVMSRAKGDLKNPIRDLEDVPDPFEALRLLDPAYPLHLSKDPKNDAFHRKTRIEYFGADFVLFETPVYRLVVFNSCSRHTTEASSYERGMIADSTLKELKLRLEECDARKINLLLCHHHPIPHDEQTFGLYDLMKNGDALLRHLSEHGDWIVLHGHKHHGRISYASGGAQAPVVFSAASVGAILSAAASLGLRNQFYILRVNLSSSGAPTGTLRVWNWTPDSGWVENNDPAEGLSSGCGFGERRHADDLAQEIAQLTNGQEMDWSNVREHLTWINHLTPHDLSNVLLVLSKKHKISCITKPNSKEILQIGPTF